MIERFSHACNRRGHLDAAMEHGVASSRLPAIKWIEDLDANPEPPPQELVEGLLHQGSKMILGAPSKSYKTWSLLDLALSVASGQPWWGLKCQQAPAIYINFELKPWAIQNRLNALRSARPECDVLGNRFAVWNLRGHSADLASLRPELEDELRRVRCGLVILDPVYKLLGDRDENSNGEIAELMNQIDLLSQNSGAAVVLAHHFAKGNAGAKEALDRMSGAGVWARDPDALLVLTPHEETGCFTVSTILRDFPDIPDWVVGWEFPLMRRLSDLNPKALRSRTGRKKVYSDAEFARLIFNDDQPRSHGTVITQAEAMGLADSSARRYLRRLVDAGLVVKAGGTYSRKEQQ